MDKCFVIQPFDKDKFDKRYTDIFEPAIIKSGLTPYRVDKDLSVSVPIDEIEKGISESSICFAEITTDNPNVWYELGFASACKKDIVMVCSEERIGKFPFDIQHRHIIKYKNNSTSDFIDLGKLITDKIVAILHKKTTVVSLNATPVKETEGLKSHEIALLILITENSFTKDDFVSIFTLKSEMGKSGYTDIATSIAIRTLETYNMIETFMAHDDWNNNNEYPACKLTEKGDNWILENQGLFQFRKPDINHFDI